MTWDELRAALIASGEWRESAYRPGSLYSPRRMAWVGAHGARVVVTDVGQQLLWPLDAARLLGVSESEART